MSPSVGDPHYPIEQYEMLRREATVSGQGLGPRGHGLALLLARGMRAWLDALTVLVPRPPSGECPLEPSRRDRVALEPTLRADLTTVLAAMVLACTAREEVRGESRPPDIGGVGSVRFVAIGTVTEGDPDPPATG